MMHKSILFSLAIVLLLPFVSAALSNSGDITLSLDQKDYYFKTGENAMILLHTNNTYDDVIHGLLGYTITKSLNQGNFQYSSSNTQSTSFSVNKGKNDVYLDFGTSNTSSTLSVNLKFSYTQKTNREVVLETIKIHFLDNNSQKNNQQKQISSSSQETQAAQQQTDPLAEQAQKMQQMMNQMNGNTQQPSKNTQQALENNQMSQDSSALKQQMQEQLQEQQQMKDAFKKQLAQNPEFQREHQALIKQGYNLTSAEVNPTSNNTGDFKLNYKKPTGEQASLKGQMQNGELKNLQKDTPELRQKLLNQLQQNEKFQKYQKQLQQQGFKQQNTDISQQKNNTNIQVNYLNPANETAKITAQIINDNVQKVELETNIKKKIKKYWWVPLIVFLFLILGYITYRKIHKKQNSQEIIVKPKIEKPFDYKSKARSMIEKSLKLFDKKEYKEAYGTAGQALRLYLSYENNLNKEITNDEILDQLRAHKKDFKEAKTCFDLCSLVEFAKYQANKKDFDKIIDYAKKIIN